MIDSLLQSFYLGIFVLVSVYTYMLLMAIDFKKIFKESSTNQIKALSIFLSMITGFLIAQIFKFIISSFEIIIFG